MMKYYIWLHHKKKMELEFAKNEKKQGKFQSLETLVVR
jgi:hypothetical protein